MTTKDVCRRSLSDRSQQNQFSLGVNLYLVTLKFAQHGSGARLIDLSTTPRMASDAIGSDGRSQRRPPQSSSDRRGGEVAETVDTSGPRYIYYRLYTTEGPIRSNNPNYRLYTTEGPIGSNNPIYANNPFISRTLPKLITPPRTASSVKRHICKIEGLSGAEGSKLFKSLSSRRAAADSSKLAFKEDFGLGSSKDDPIVVVVGVEDVKNRKANATQLVGLPEALPFEPRYVHYRLYDEGGAKTSKAAFDMDDSSLGRIDTLSIVPPQTLASLRSQVMKTEGFVNQNIQLFEDMDGEVPMNDNNAHISFQTQIYPGNDEGQPITIVCSRPQIRGESIKKQLPKMSLLTKWQTSLPGSGNEVTMLVNQTGVYAGSNGYVYLLDCLKGSVLETNTLRGMGYREVRLAQPEDGSSLLVGTNGYVLRLDPTSLNTSWQTSLPKCGYSVVSLLCANGSAFAGCNGYVYRLDQGSGAVLATEYLKFDNEVRLGISLDFSTLFVGLDGYALGLNPTDLSISWNTSLPGCGYGITSIVAGVNAAYAGCNGYVYQLQQSTGKVLHRNGLSGIGMAEVRMALDPAAAHLYVGTNGYGIGLRPDNLATVYSVRLPESGYSVTDVVAGNEVAFFANDGYVFQLDVAGKVDDEDSLVRMRYHETRLAIARNTATQLFVGIKGYARGLSLPNYPVVSDPWMRKLAPVIGPMMLREIAIPGTHNSGTYGIGVLSAIGEDGLSWLKQVEILPQPAIVVKAIVANWSIAQAANFSAQLASGIRYFDLRVQGGEESLNFVHGLVGSPVTELIDQLTEFFSQPTNNQEIILLDFNHFYSMTSALHEKLPGMLLSAFGNKLAPASLGTNVTLDQLWASTHRIITFYDDATAVCAHPFLWPQQDISSPWPNKQDIDSLHVALDSKLPNTHSTFFVLQGVLSPTFDVIAQGLVPFSQAPNSLASQAKSVNKQLLSWFGGWKSKGINIVICDWFSGTYNYADAVVNLNQHIADAYGKQD